MYNLKFGQNGHFNIKKTNQKNHVSFIPFAFNQNRQNLGQCGHFNQIECFEKP
jgi:hypothetical protein